MNYNRPTVIEGQKYQDVKERSGRTLTVLSVSVQRETVGRYKGGHSYATVLSCDRRKIKIDTLRLSSNEYRLLPELSAAAA